jgi:hypothetical protein
MAVKSIIIGIMSVDTILFGRQEAGDYEKVNESEIKPAL